MIVEQILPFFSPDYTITVRDIPDLELSKDIPIVLNSVNYEDTWDGQLQQRRTVIWTLGFTAKMYLYPPVGLSKMNLKTNIVWHLSQSMTADVSQKDLITPTPDSTPDSITPVITHTSGSTFQQMSGRARIRRSPIRNMYGISTISLGQTGTPNSETQSGITRITNPEAFHPGFQEEPIQTLTELNMQLQKGKTAILKRTTQTRTGTSNIVFRTVRTQTGTSNIVSAFDNESFQPGVFQ